MELGGMTCPSCMDKIKTAVEHQAGVSDVKVLFNAGKLKAKVDTNQSSADDVKKVVWRFGLPSQRRKGKGDCLMTKEELYQAELKQADQDHHTPTAGAMTGHILANLWLHQQKVNQARLYAKGCASSSLTKRRRNGWQPSANTLTGSTPSCLAWGSRSNTTAQFVEYAMLKEDGAGKVRARQGPTLWPN